MGPRLNPETGRFPDRNLAGQNVHGALGILQRLLSVSERPIDRAEAGITRPLDLWFPRPSAGQRTLFEWQDRFVGSAEAEVRRTETGKCNAQVNEIS
jgi:hypothetical protein